MTPAAFKAQREALGLSARQMALALGWGAASERSVRRLEAGDYPVTGPVARAVALLRRLHAEGHRGDGLVKAAQREAQADHDTAVKPRRGRPGTATQWSLRVSSGPPAGSQQ